MVALDFLGLQPPRIRHLTTRATRPSIAQVRAARDVSRWYFDRYYGRAEDPGLPAMFAASERVGAFKIDLEQLRAGAEEHLFRLLVTIAMFQRRQDVQILRILRGISDADANELSSADRLVSLAASAECALTKSNDALLASCDLTKDARGVGTCSANSDAPCHLKRHTVLLKRYGHFGKVPTSIALMVRESAGTLTALRERVLREYRSRRARAIALEASLSKAWRVSQKIASMFLANVCNPDLLPGAAWAEGVDWTYFVVVDSNVDLFLSSIGYAAGRSYDARRDFIISLAGEVDLRAVAGGRRVRTFNPRLLQQAMYLFMSATNRRASLIDCALEGSAACRRCPSALSTRCALRAPAHRA